MRIGKKRLELTELFQGSILDHKEMDPHDEGRIKYTWRKYYPNQEKQLVFEENILRIIPNRSFNYEEGVQNEYNHKKDGFKEGVIPCTKIVLKENLSKYILVKETYEEILKLLKSEDQFPSLSHKKNLNKLAS